MNWNGGLGENREGQVDDTACTDCEAGTAAA
jgi:hypothetical protein